MLNTKLKPGLYKLTQTLTNPDHDKRVSRDWTRLATFEAGTRFVIREYMRDNDLQKDDSYLTLEEFGCYGSVHEYDERYKLITQFLEKEEESLDELLDKFHIRGTKYILQKLVDSGKVSLKEIENILTEEDED